MLEDIHSPALTYFLMYVQGSLTKGKWSELSFQNSSQDSSDALWLYYCRCYKFIASEARSAGYGGEGRRRAVIESDELNANLTFKILHFTQLDLKEAAAARCREIM